MAATDPRPSSPPEVPSPTTGQNPPEDEAPPPGDEPLTADLAGRAPRISTRTLVTIALALVVLLVVSVVVAFVILHQPHLSPVPVPSLPSIA